MRFVCAAAVALSLAPVGGGAAGQGQPATVPTAVAQATSLERPVYGVPKYFDGRTPPTWPAALVPTGATVIGGGVQEIPGRSRIQNAVFVFGTDTKPADVLDRLLENAGYSRHETIRGGPGGGFVSGGSLAYTGPQYCNGSVWAGYEPVDSTQSLFVIGVRLIDGDAGRQTCSALNASPTTRSSRVPVTVPPLTPPRGALPYAPSASWSGSSGTMRVNLRTTLAVDSVLDSYTTQLVTAGWKSLGPPAITEGVAVQGFSLREGPDAWAAVLIVIPAGEHRDVTIMLTKVE